MIRLVTPIMTTNMTIILTTIVIAIATGIAGTNIVASETTILSSIQANFVITIMTSYLLIILLVLS